jgi:hypothetical protein
VLWPNNLCLNKHILPINYATQVNPTHPVTYSEISCHGSVWVNLNDRRSLEFINGWEGVGEWLVGRAVLIEGEQNIYIFFKKLSNFERFKLFLQELFFRNYFSGIIFRG